MDEAKQDDKTHRGETGPIRVYSDDQGTVADVICASGHAYQVVHSQESTWMFYLRLTTIDGNHVGIVRIVLGPGSEPGRPFPIDVRYYPATGGAAGLI